MRDWNQFFTVKEIDQMSSDGITIHSFTELLNDKIREAIEAAPKVYQDPLIGWCIRNDGDAKSTGRLIDVNPIEKGDL